MLLFDKASLLRSGFVRNLRIVLSFTTLNRTSFLPGLLGESFVIKLTYLSLTTPEHKVILNHLDYEDLNQSIRMS
jgi:hypothetical protein